MITTALCDIGEDLPISFESFNHRAQPTGLVIVDIVNGFATVGAGPLAPAGPDEQVERMVSETDALARTFTSEGRPVLAFLDTHHPGKPEPPYPPHCEEGSGQENLVPALTWMEAEKLVTLVRKDCINGFIGAIDVATGRNAVTDWIRTNRLEAVLVVGICTDICVMDFVLTLLSARNHDLVPPLKDVVVYEQACATYDLPRPVALAAGLPATAAHPKAITHHAGLYFMASRGAVLASRVE